MCRVILVPFLILIGAYAIVEQHKNRECTEMDSIFSDFSEFVVGTDGVYMYPKDDSAIGPPIKKYGHWEKPLKDLAISLLEKIWIQKLYMQNVDTGIVILDVGCNFGSWSIPLGNAVRQRGKVYAFDIQRHMINYLHMNILANKLTNIYPMHLALSNTTGYFDIDDTIFEKYSGLKNYGHASLHSLRAGKSMDKPQKIRMETLDNLYNSKVIECPHLIKADIEGYEMHLFLGSQHLLRECRPILVFEADCKILMRSLITLLDHLGYSLAWVSAAYLDMSVEFNGYTPGVDGTGVYGGRFSDPEYANWAVVGGNNIIAVPKKMKHILLEYPSSLQLIDMAAGLYHVDDYNIEICYNKDSYTNYWCIRRSHGTNSCLVDDETLGVDEYIVNYWKNFE